MSGRYRFFIQLIGLMSCLIFSPLTFAGNQTETIKNETLKQEVQYVNYREIFPAQMRYSSQNVKDKIDRAQQKGYLICSENGEWNYQFFNGKSIIPEKEALPVVKASFGYVLADGHHDVLSSLSVGAEWIPIKVIADLSHLSVEQFWKQAEQNGWAYLIDLNGEKQATPPQSFQNLKDDSNRYFAAITARKYSADLSSSVGAEYPLWIKVGKDIPFIEFKIADVLWRNGLVYQYEMGDEPPVEFVERARLVLLKSNIPGLKSVAVRTHYSQINKETLVTHAN